MNILRQVFQCLQYHLLKTQKISMIYAHKDCKKKFCESLREEVMKIINFNKNEIAIKRTAGIIWN